MIKCPIHKEKQSRAVLTWLCENLSEMSILASQGLIIPVLLTKFFRFLPFQPEMWLQQIKDKKKKDPGDEMRAHCEKCENSFLWQQTVTLNQPVERKCK